MFILRPVARRVLYVLAFEAFAIALGTLLLGLLNASDAHSNNLVMAAGASVIAVAWNYVYNTGFEAWERRTKRTDRTVILRVLHTVGFEGGLIVLLIPCFMWWYSVDVATAFKMEAALLVFFLVYNFVFTFLFDQVFERENATLAS